MRRVRKTRRIATLGHRVRTKYKGAGEIREGVMLGPYGSLCLHRVLVLCGLDDCFAIKCKRCGHRWCNDALDRMSLRLYRRPRARKRR